MEKTPKPLMMLINPSSGRSVSEPMLGAAVAPFCQAGYAPTVYFTTGPGSATSLTAAHAPLSVFL